MTTQDQPWDRLPASAFSLTPATLRTASALQLAQGALRVQCPATGSFVLITDEAMLARLDGPRARLSCPSCGGTHRLIRETAEDDAGFAAGDIARN